MVGFLEVYGYQDPQGLERRPRSASDGFSQSSAWRLVAFELTMKPQPEGVGDFPQATFEIVSKSIQSSINSVSGFSSSLKRLAVSRRQRRIRSW